MSYGGIPKGMTKERFLSGETQPVNEELMSIFIQCDIVEHSGHGVPIVVREYGEKAYKFNENSIIVTIPFDKTGFDSQNAHQNSLIIIKNLIENNPQVTLNEMAEAIGKTVKTVQRLIKDSNCIEYVGSSKKGYWKLK